MNIRQCLLAERGIRCLALIFVFATQRYGSQAILSYIHKCFCHFYYRNQKIFENFVIVFLLWCAASWVLNTHFLCALFLTLASLNSLVLGYTEVKVYNKNNDGHLLIIFILKKNPYSIQISKFRNELGSFTKYLDDTYLWLFHDHLIHRFILFHKFHGTASIRNMFVLP